MLQCSFLFSFFNCVQSFFFFGSKTDIGFTVVYRVDFSQLPLIIFIEQQTAALIWAMILILPLSLLGFSSIFSNIFQLVELFVNLLSVLLFSGIKLVSGSRLVCFGQYAGENGETTSKCSLLFRRKSCLSRLLQALDTPPPPPAAKWMFGILLPQ